MFRNGISLLAAAASIAAVLCLAPNETPASDTRPDQASVVVMADGRAGCC